MFEIWMPVAAVFILGAYLLARTPLRIDPNSEPCKRCSDAEELNDVEKERMFFEFMEKLNEQNLAAVHETVKLMLGTPQVSEELEKEKAIRRELEMKWMDDVLRLQEHRSADQFRYFEDRMRQLEEKRGARKILGRLSGIKDR